MGKRKTVSDTERVIGILYVAIQKPHWAHGPTIEEAISAANDWYYNTHEVEDGAASDEIPKMYKREIINRKAK